MNLPKGINVSELKMTLTQEEDSCGRNDIRFQDLDVEFTNAGGGFYYILKTERWAMDSSDRSLFIFLDEFCKELDKKSIFKKDNTEE